MTVSRQWPLAVVGSITEVSEAVRRTIASSDRWELANEFPNDFRVLRRPPRWMLSLSTVIRVQFEDLGDARTLVGLSIDSPPFIYGDVFQTYLHELEAFAEAISSELPASPAPAAALPSSRRVSRRETVLLGALLIGLVGALLLWVTDSWLSMLALVPLVVFALYSSATKPVPPPDPRTMPVA